MELIIGILLAVLGVLGLLADDVKMDTWLAIVLLVCGLALVLTHFGVLSRLRR